MILLTVDEIISLHDKLIEKTGGIYGVRDKNLLESAIFSSEAIFENTEIYPSTEEKAARLCFAITNNHAFADGNKRIGVLTMLLTLRLNGINLSYSQQELISLALSVAEGKTRYEGILEWIHAHNKR